MLLFSRFEKTLEDRDEATENAKVLQMSDVTIEFDKYI